MIITINDDWRLSSDPLQWILQKRNPGATEEKHVWRSLGFFGDLDNAVAACGRRRIRILPGFYGPEALTPLCAALDTIPGGLRHGGRRLPPEGRVMRALYWRPVEALPRLSREGFVPAGPTGRTDRRNMLIPKPASRSEFIPALPADQLSWLAAELGPPERRAMREIAQGGDLADVGGTLYLVAQVSDATIEALAVFEAEGEDREDFEDDAVNEDGTDESSLDWGTLPCGHVVGDY